MNKIVEFNARKEKVDFEKQRDKYKKDFKDFVQKRAEEERIFFFETRKEM